MVLLLVFGHADVFFNPSAYGDEGFGGSFVPVGALEDFVARAVRLPAATGFFFISGITLARRYGAVRTDGSTRSYASHVLRRAAFFLALEPLVIGHLWTASMTENMIAFGVISCFALCFLASVGFSRLGPMAAVALAVALVLGKELLRIPAPADPLSPAAMAYGLLWEPVFYAGHWYASYPVAGWLPAMLLGYAFGVRLLARKPGATPSPRPLLVASVGLAVAFFALRLSTTFGSLGQAVPGSAVELFNMSKYPPSLHMILCALSLVVLIVAISARLSATPQSFVFRFFAGYGRQAFFVYIVLAVGFGIPGVVFGWRADGSLFLSTVVFFLSLYPMLRTAEAYDRFKRQHRARIWILKYV